MSENSADRPRPRLVLHSRLEDLSAVHPWLEALAAEYAIPDQTQFSIDLCLEEALSNVIRHGYGPGSDQTISVDFTADEAGGFSLVIEDRAPPFNPLEQTAKESAEKPPSLDEFEAGGRGISFMRKFASSLKYERLPNGNRLTIGFAS